MDEKDAFDGLANFLLTEDPLRFASKFIGYINTQEKFKKYNITKSNGLYGCTTLNIPFEYYDVSITSKFLIFIKNDTSVDHLDYYDLLGHFLFSCCNAEDLKEDIFLITKKEYINEEKIKIKITKTLYDLTNKQFISDKNYTKSLLSSYNRQGLCILYPFNSDLQHNTFCVLDFRGNEIFKGIKSFSETPTLHGVVLLHKEGKEYYNLLTKEVILTNKYSFSGKLETNNYIFLKESSYDNEKEVYQISKHTGEVIKHL